MIKNIVFDMGNVLLKYSPEEMLERYTTDKEDISLIVNTVFMSEEWQYCDRGDGFREDILPPVIEKLPVHLQDIAKQLLYRNDLELNFMPETKGIRQLISGLKNAGYGIYLLSNVGLCYPGLYANHPVFKEFDGYFASAEYHLLKPAKEIYEKFFDVFSLAPDECVFIDDSTANCKGSEECGMKAVCFNCKEQTVDELKSMLRYEGITI